MDATEKQESFCACWRKISAVGCYIVHKSELFSCRCEAELALVGLVDLRDREKTLDVADLEEKLNIKLVLEAAEIINLKQFCCLY